MIYLVTGANGWLGRRVLRALAGQLPEIDTTPLNVSGVRALVTLAEDTREIERLGIEVVRNDVRDPAAMDQFMKGGEGGRLVHLAGIIHPKSRTQEFFEINVQGTRNVISAAEKSGVARAVVMSSNSPIGVSKNPFEVFDEDSPYRPYMGYGSSKQKMEEWLLDRMRQQIPPEAVIIRAPWFYGPEQPLRQTRFFTMIRDGHFPLMGRGENRRSMGYVDSLAQGILLASDREAAAGKVYWLADERPYPMHEIVSTVGAVLSEDFGIHVNPKVMRVPGVVADIARLGDRLVQSVGLYNQSFHVLSEMNLTIACSINKARSELGYQPLVDLREGMRRSVAWCLEHGIPLS